MDEDMEALVRIMVTGAEGYLGGVVTQRLLRRGHEVVSIDAGYFANLPGPKSSSRDVRDLDGADLDGIDGIVHLAALSNDACSELHQDVCVDVNEVHSVRLAHMARQHGIARFVFASTCSVYGAGGGRPAIESDTVNPLSVYAVTKHRAEQRISALAGDGFTPVILRFATLFGPSPNMRTDLVVNRMAASAVTRGRIELTGAATNYRPILHVRDAAADVEAALAGDLSRTARCFNVAAAHGNIQIAQIAQAVQDVIGGVDLEVVDTHHDPRSYAVDTALLDKTGLFGHSPTQMLLNY
ncbi:nucleoside-diphosphate-sugar epimerase [Catenulispora sp. GP43]|uniref:SDR family oxidoreductase n=1 Tax=Catenulispora sp. GP43 TaxID=3156263 RepID=UPI0035163D74